MCTLPYVYDNFQECQRLHVSLFFHSGQMSKAITLPQVNSKSTNDRKALEKNILKIKIFMIMRFLAFSFELLDSEPGISRNKTQCNMNYLLVIGDQVVISKVLPRAGLTQPALDGLSCTALLTYCHLDPFP